MIGLLQRVIRAEVQVGEHCVGAIGPGLLVFVGVCKGDGEPQADHLLERLLNYRVFEDDTGRMNLSLLDTGGGLLLVPQFTLAADTHKGRRPSFSTAAAPQDGERLFTHLLDRARHRIAGVQSGQFGADMQVGLINDGPVTFWLES